ncbi:hypothetical protein Tco_0669538, partial [Tanacetum coccineum]
GDHYLPSAEPGTALLLARAVEVIRLSSGFLGVGTTFDIFLNIILYSYLEYGV